MTHLVGSIGDCLVMLCVMGAVFHIPCYPSDTSFKKPSCLSARRVGARGRGALFMLLLLRVLSTRYLRPGLMLGEMVWGK